MTISVYNTLLTAIALGLACSVLSVIVVLRRWAFIGEGISHSGFGGAGTAWMLMLLFPALAEPWIAYSIVILFCLATALAIGFISRGGRVHSDAAIGIFLVASLAWGFLAQHFYQATRHVLPVLWDELLFGRAMAFSNELALAAVVVSLVVLLAVVVLWKEIIAYTFDPLLAETSGVPGGFVHYLLLILIAITIIVGIRIAGAPLMTGLLIFPGATALLLARQLRSVVIISIIVALIGTVGGMMLSQGAQRLPPGPAIVLILFIEFLISWLASRFGRTAA